MLVAVGVEQLLLLILLGLPSHLLKDSLLLNIVVVAIIIIIITLLVEAHDWLAHQRRLVAVIAICATDSATTT